MRAAMFLVAIWAVLFGFYLLCAGSVTRPEAIAGAVASGMAAAGHMRTRAVAQRQLLVRAPWFWLAMRIAVGLARDSALVGGGLVRSVLGRKPGGGMTMQPFDPGELTPLDAARRAIVMLGASVAPNGYVIEVREPPQGMLMHALVPRKPTADRRWPV